MLGCMSHFKILIQHYLRCPLRTAVTARRASTQLSDCTPLLHVMYERVKAAYFSLPRHCPPEAAVKEECELSHRNNWPWSGASRGAGGAEGRWQRRLGKAVEGRTPRRGSHSAATATAAASPTLRPVNWNTKHSGVDEGVLVDCAGRGSAVCLNLHCRLGIDWGTSERDRHTVTGKMNCHLAFLSLLAAAKWLL